MKHSQQNVHLNLIHLLLEILVQAVRGREFILQGFSTLFSIELFLIGIYSLIIEPFSIENFTHYIIWVRIHIICKEIRPDILEQCTRVDLIQGRLKWMGTKRPNTINIAHSIRSKYIVK